MNNQQIKIQSREHAFALIFQIAFNEEYDYQKAFDNYDYYAITLDENAGSEESEITIKDVTKLHSSKTVIIEEDDIIETVEEVVYIREDVDDIEEEIEIEELSELAKIKLEKAETIRLFREKHGIKTYAEINETAKRLLEEDEQEELAKLIEIFIDKEFIYREFSGTIQNLSEIDSYIEKYSKGWSINRLDKAILAVLRLAIYEMLYADDIGLVVSINEALNLTKKYCDDKSTKFVNGILASVYKELDESK